MATTTSHNKKSSAVKRILSEARELEADQSKEYEARPLEDNIFEWHFTLRGPSGTEFEKGIYHGRIVLPTEYPFRPPSLMLLTPNGRWECNKKICLTFTGFHEEMWQPAWGIRTALLGVQAFMSAKAEAATGIGSLDYPAEDRKKLAERSTTWTCDQCQKSNVELLPEIDDHTQRTQEDLPEGLQIDPSGGRQDDSTKESPASGSGSSQNNIPQRGCLNSTSAANSKEFTEQRLSPSQVGGLSPSGEDIQSSTSSPNHLNNTQIADLRPPPSTPSVPQTPSEPSSSQATLTSPTNVSSATPPRTPSVRTELKSPGPSPLSRVNNATTTALPPLQRVTQLQSSSPNTLSPPVHRPIPHQPSPLHRVQMPATENTQDGQTAQQTEQQVQPPQPPPVPPRQPTRSEARVAQLDRAILTVVLLLCGLIVRRLL
ncbi:unnamed protein product [Sympodiomycopsis kandeliae]